MSDEEHWTILRTLEWIQGYFGDKGIATPRLDAEVIVAHVLSVERIMLYARFDQPLQPRELAAIKTLVARRARREPIAHIVGKKEFWSLNLTVNDNCLVPRPDSETIVEVALRAAEGRRIERAVDVGTGSGCLAFALAKELPNAHLFALEVSEGARKVAQYNAECLELTERVTLVDSNLLDSLPDAARPIDLLVANLPYIPTPEIEQLMPDVRFFEPHIALDGGPDGLDLYRRLLTQMDAALSPGAPIVFEAGPDQVETLAKLLAAAGVENVSIHDDGAGMLRAASGTAATSS